MMLYSSSVITHMKDCGRVSNNTHNQHLAGPSLWQMAHIWHITNFCIVKQLRFGYIGTKNTRDDFKTNHSWLKATKGKVQCITGPTTPACPWRHVINFNRFADVQISIFERRETTPPFLKTQNRYGLFRFTARQRNNYVFWLNGVSTLGGATPLQKQRKRLIMEWWDADDQLGGGGGGRLWFKDLDKLRLNHFIWLVFEAMNLN